MSAVNNWMVKMGESVRLEVHSMAPRAEGKGVRVYERTGRNTQVETNNLVECWRYAAEGQPMTDLAPAR